MTQRAGLIDHAPWIRALHASLPRMTYRHCNMWIRAHGAPTVKAEGSQYKIQQQK